MYKRLRTLPLGSTFQAMVSVVAVKIQLSSPIGVFLSFKRPGILSIKSRVTPESNERETNLYGVLVSVL